MDAEQLEGVSTIWWERRGWRYSGMINSILYFVLAGLLEIGGGYLVWLWLREGRSIWCAILGALLLVGYGVVPTLQPAGFGRVYAAYGGIFVAMALLWGWWVDGIRPDRFDLIGAVVVLVGVGIIMYAPRDGSETGNGGTISEQSR